MKSAFLQNTIPTKSVVGFILSGLNLFEALKKSASAPKLRSDTEVIYNGLENEIDLVAEMSPVVEKTEDASAKLPVTERSNPVGVFSTKKLKVKAKAEVKSEPKIKCAVCSAEVGLKFVDSRGRCTICYFKAVIVSSASESETAKPVEKPKNPLLRCRKCDKDFFKNHLKGVEGKSGMFCDPCIDRIAKDADPVPVSQDQSVKPVQKAASKKPALTTRQQEAAKKWGINPETGKPYTRKTSPKAKGVAKSQEVKPAKPQKLNRKHQRAQAATAGK